MSETIHWHGTPKGFCARKDSGADVTSEKSGEATITHSALANHFGNVTCKRCREYHRQQWHVERQRRRA